MKPETAAAQALHAIDPVTGAVVPPIHLATTYARDADYAVRGAVYTRDENPTPVVAERVLAELEGGAAALTFSSGMAAATAAIRAVCKPGDHVLGPRVAYYALRAWLARFCARWGVEHDAIDMTDLAEVRRALRPNTRVVWIETPTNPTWDVTDIAAVAELAHGAGALLAVDSTCATPVHSRPLALGADRAVHDAVEIEIPVAGPQAVGDQRFGINWIHVDRTVQVASQIHVVVEADDEVLGQLVLKAEVCLF